MDVTWKLKSSTPCHQCLSDGWRGPPSYFFFFLSFDRALCLLLCSLCHSCWRYRMAMLIERAKHLMPLFMTEDDHWGGACRASGQSSSTFVSWKSACVSNVLWLIRWSKSSDYLLDFDPLSDMNDRNSFFLAWDTSNWRFDLVWFEQLQC